MIERIRAALRRRPLLGAGISLAVHAALLIALLWVPPHAKSNQKRGDALIVELPNADELAARGAPGLPADGPPAPAATPPRPTPPTPPAPKAPPTPKVPSAPKVAAAPRQPAPPRAPSPEVPRTPPQPAPSVEQGETQTAKSAPQPPAEEVTKPAPEPERQETATAPTPPSPPGPVAMVPPAPPDIRSAFRRGPGGSTPGTGGLGGSGVGRGGIVGEPIPLDSKDKDLSDYLERIKRLIYQNWAYPCVKDRDTRVCEYKNAQLIVEFGILKQGPVQYVQVRRTSDWAIYDEFAVNAIKLASPFPPVPPAMMSRMQSGSTGAAIVARFTYVIDTGLTNVLR